ncbi:hypothetical protein F5Y16DRAFT_154969 [Xylariaceae sp. FL0255]|nr:hypothetical protein F5Y16DRAFT_154969 [Xylariaceae sp. FL0255]
MSAGKTIGRQEDPTALLGSCKEEILEDEIPVFRISAVTLQYPTDSEAMLAKLASDVSFVCQAMTASGRLEDVVEYIWMGFIHIAERVTPDSMGRLSSADY